MKRIIIILTVMISAAASLNAQVQVWLPDTTASPGSTIMIPVYTTDVDTSLEVLAYQMEIIYDEAVAHFDSFDIAGTITPENWTHTYNLDTTGVVSGGSWYFEPPYLQGEGALVYLEFNIPETAAGTTALSFTQFFYNEDSISTIDGSITIELEPVTIDGNAFLENQTNHEGTKALFQADGIGAVTDSTYTDSAGYYQIDIQPGEYDIFFSHDGYQTEELLDQSLIVNTTLPEVTLLEDSISISGSLSGTLAGVIYIVTADIMVNQGDSLIIEPGAVFCFRGNADFQIYGYLYAVGTETDSIIFKEYDSFNPNWQGITFQLPSDDSSIMEYSRIQSAAVDGLKINYCSPSITHCMIVYNTYNGISIYQSSSTFEWCEISYNASEGIQCFSNSTVSFLNCSIQRNSSHGLMCLDGSVVTMEGCDISFNLGSGIYCDDADLQIIGNSITYNENSGIYAVNSTSSVIDSTIISGNSGEFGGGIYCNNSNPSVSNCTISGNLADDDGGGVYCYNYSSPNFFHCTISGNTALDQGGGIRFTNGSSSIFNHCIIHGNTSMDDGGGIYCYSSSPTISNCTFNGNSTSGDGSGILFSSSDPDIVNTIFSNHSGMGCIYFNNSPNSSITYCDFNDNEGGNFTGSVPPFLGQVALTNANGDSCDTYYNIYLDPEFYSTTGDSAFHLTENSPCIDAGNPASPPDPDGTIADIGALYFQQQAIWQLTLTCTGEEGTAPNQFILTIGGDEQQNFTPAPPQPPEYMCWTQLWDTTAVPWGGPYSEMIYQWVDTNEYVWTLEIDPNGNVMPPEARTSTFTWDPDDLPLVPPDYGFRIEDEEGIIIVPDMSQQDSLQITGSSTVFYYIKYGHSLVWQLVLTCTGEEGAAPNQFNLTIGGGDLQINIPSLSPPPEYMCWTQLWDTTAAPWGGPYSQMVYEWVDTNEYIWTLEVDPNGNVTPPVSRTAVFSWNPDGLPIPPADYGFWIEDEEGIIVVADMYQPDSLMVTGESNVFYYLKYGRTIVHYEFDLPQYWSLISLPVIPTNFDLSFLFPNATVAYAFENATYVQATELDNGKAYWVYVPEAEVDTVWGLPFTEYSISVTPPWEMLGSVFNSAVPVVTPGSIVVMYLFDQTYYQVPDLVMQPGLGYWVNLTEDVTIFSLGGGGMLAGSGTGDELAYGKSSSGKTSSASSENWELPLIITGEYSSIPYIFTLKIGCNESLNLTPAPPAPPQYSAWSALYEEEWASGPYFTMIQPSDSVETITWLLSVDPNGNIVPPVSQTATVEWDVLNLPEDGILYIEDCATGEIMVEDMRNQNSFDISGVETHHYQIIGNLATGIGCGDVESLPDNYVLEQNRPNPFNPTTQIKYYLKHTGAVNLTVYNIMGEEVAVLVNDVQADGYHTVNFDGSNLPSGIYFYRLKAGGFSDIKKMIIIK
ncbi:MAG: right-handed parallel beta-helix repeat-containing protein [candidate division Zixibacteria bacterium]|nr:right-handed parallel beta-helix repeat-containing protein [Candidatus Tariuqbacter arcticus]